jgi:prepilin-type N-terminal cleavage/methylation domain-containing protein
MKKAFTLIELLIVVAIIAILAAIAVPNFLEAQVRSKVSRVKAELRTLATAIESYQVDHSKPCPQSRGSAPANTIFSAIQPGGGTGTLTHALTTPIAYMTSFMFYDPFSVAGTAIDEKLYSWHPYQWIWPQRFGATGPVFTADNTLDNGVGGLDGYDFKELYGNWRLLSIGPDKTYYNQEGFSSPKIRIPYDPTNGTVHWGNIIRSHSQPEQKTFFTTNAAHNTGL